MFVQGQRMAATNSWRVPANRPRRVQNACLHCSWVKQEKHCQLDSALNILPRLQFWEKDEHEIVDNLWSSKVFDVWAIWPACPWLILGKCLSFRHTLQGRTWPNHVKPPIVLFLIFAKVKKRRSWRERLKLWLRKARPLVPGIPENPEKSMQIFKNWCPWIKAVGNTFPSRHSEVKTLARQVVRSRKAVARLERSPCEIGEYTAMMLESLESKQMITQVMFVVDKIVAYSTKSYHRCEHAAMVWCTRLHSRQAIKCLSCKLFSMHGHRSSWILMISQCV